MDRQQWQSNTEYKSHKATNGPLDGHKGPRLYGNRNQQRRLCSAPAVLTHAGPLRPRFTSMRPPISWWPLYPKLVHFYRFHKARKREVLPSDLCLNQLQIPLTLALKSGLTHPPSLGTQGIYTKIYTVDASGIQVSKQKNHIQINMENDQKIAHRVNCAMIKNDD